MPQTKKQKGSLAKMNNDPEVNFILLNDGYETIMMVDGVMVAAWDRTLTNEEMRLLIKHKGNFHAAMQDREWLRDNHDR